MIGCCAIELRKRGRALAGEMGAQQRRQSGAVTRGKRVDHCRVFGECRIPFLAIEIGSEAHRLQPSVQSAVRLSEHRITGQTHDQGMNRAIQTVVGRQITP